MYLLFVPIAKLKVTKLKSYHMESEMKYMSCTWKIAHELHGLYDMSCTTIYIWII